MKMFLKVTSYFRACLALGVAFCACSTFAQYPNKTIRIEVGFVAGGTPDIVARLFSQKLSTVLGQPVIVENKSGSAGNSSRYGS